MFNSRHRLESINKILRQANHLIEKREHVYVLREKVENSSYKGDTVWRDCGVYYTKKDAANMANIVLNCFLS